MATGYLAIILHCHLPFVRHPEHGEAMEERWLFEAITETYLPLLDMMEWLIRDGVDFRLTFSLSPPLLHMLADDLLQRKFQAYLDRLIDLAGKEVERTSSQPEFNRCARMYFQKFGHLRHLYNEVYHGDLIAAFQRFQAARKIETITCSATHCVLPLMSIYPVAVNAQISLAQACHRHYLGRPARGIWNAECAYYPGLDDILKRHDFEFSFVDTHGFDYAENKVPYGVYAPIRCPSGVYIFGRDPESSKSVWCAQEGYPGDYNYREFYRDVGYDLDYDYIKPYIHETGQRVSTGIKYYRVTDRQVPLDKKEPYDPDKAKHKAAEHAGNFMFNRQHQVRHLASIMNQRPIIVAPYDAELFGHWWFEGPEFLNSLIRNIFAEQEEIELITPSEYIDMNPSCVETYPSFSTWGYKGYCESWLNSSNDWIYRHLHKATERMTELAKENPEAESIKSRALNQAARELLLAQSSDWPFIMHTGTVVDYAQRCIKDHLTQFTSLYNMIKSENIDENYLCQLETRNNIFPQMDYRIYRPAE